MAASTRPLYALVDRDTADRLCFVARRRGMEPAEFLGWILSTWIEGPGRAELLQAVAGGDETGNVTPIRGRRRSTRKAERGVPGQMTIDMAEPPPF